jgi:hypothetical protein
MTAATTKGTGPDAKEKRVGRPPPKFKAAGNVTRVAALGGGVEGSAAFAVDGIDEVGD